jgi:hypothetical protein
MCRILVWLEHMPIDSVFVTLSRALVHIAAWFDEASPTDFTCTLT